LNYCAQLQGAIPLAKQAIRLSPVAQTWFPEVLATAYYLSGRFEEAIAAANQALALAPDSFDARLMLAAALVATGRCGWPMRMSPITLISDASSDLNVRSSAGDVIGLLDVFAVAAHDREGL
jgi:tetratricopeptide (TPR) repeat protein